jgi:hypothetical protein
LNNRAGIIGDRVVKLSQKQAETSITLPTVNKDTVLAEDPAKCQKAHPVFGPQKRLTASLATIQANEQTKDAPDDEEEPEEIEIANVFAKRPAFVRIDF